MTTSLRTGHDHGVRVLNGKKIVVVMPAFRAGRTLRVTYEALPSEVVDEVIVVDDASDDDTVAVARTIPVRLVIHAQNAGYGANQKTCYQEALQLGADVVVMVHPDYQYEPRLVTAMAAMVASGVYDVVLGSRVLGANMPNNRMPWWRYIANRLLTGTQNVLLHVKLSEYHTGFRAYSKEFLSSTPWTQNSDDFVFDNELLVQALVGAWRVGEISVPTRYFAEASSISFTASVLYGLGVLRVTAAALYAKIRRKERRSQP